jgi:arylsulfatase
LLWPRKPLVWFSQGLISGTNGQVALPNKAAPLILSKSWTLTADIELPEDGGLVGGYGLHGRDGKPTFVYNCLVLDRFTFPGKEPLPKGKM